jgi:hypothetical protein
MFGEEYKFQRISPCPRLLVNFCNKVIFYDELLAPRPTKGPPLVGCRRLLIQHIRSYPPYLEVVLVVMLIVENCKYCVDMCLRRTENLDKGQIIWNVYM